MVGTDKNLELIIVNQEKSIQALWLEIHTPTSF